MIQDHLNNLTTIKANLKKAIRNRETVVIGGGKFSGEELTSLLMAVDSNLSHLQESEPPLSP